MKTILSLAGLLVFYNGFTQCPFPVTLSSTTDNCLGATLNVSSGNTVSKIVWSDGNAAVNTVTATATQVNGVTVAGGNGRGNYLNQFTSVMTVFVDKSGFLYAGDFSMNRVVKFPPGSSSVTNGVVVAGDNGEGPASNQLNEPRDIFVDDLGNVYVADAVNSRVQKWAPGAILGVTVAGGHGPGSAANQLGTDLGGLFVDGLGNIYVNDGDNFRVQKWAPGATAGVTVAGGNGSGSAANQLAGAAGLFVDGTGNLYVADFYNNRIQKWLSGATSATTVAGGNGMGSAANQFDGPRGISVDANGNIFVADWNNNRIQKWAPGATTGETVAGGNGAGSGADQLNFPMDVYVDGNGNMYVADHNNNRVQKWGIEYTIDKTYKPQTPGTYIATITDNSGCTVVSNAIVISPTVTPGLTITASTTTICSGTNINFLATPVNGGTTPSYQWQLNGVNTGTNDLVYTNNSLVNGDIVSCVMLSNAVCTAVPTAQSNTIPVTVNTSLATTMRIESSANPICSGNPVSFKAFVTNGGANGIYTWELNGINTGSNNPGYSSNNFRNGDIVICRYTSNSGCADANSNSIALTVNPSPGVDAGQDLSVSAGQAITLHPTVTGNINKYTWSPGAGLSDSTIVGPVARPLKTTLYTLTVTTAAGCSASGQVKVNVFSNLAVPNAFTPNGDGRNDIFYILGGQEGSRIREFSIFDRWGQKLFGVHDVLPADPAFGWNGYYKGMPAPAGVYVYMVKISENGTQQTLKGTVILIR